MKKQRGLRRYYKNLVIRNDFEQMNFLDFQNDSDVWFDRRHWHFDRYGFGENSFKRRKPHLDKLFRHFEMLIAKTAHLKTDFQLFILLLDRDSSSDALFLHTPNPNNSDFPLTWKNLSEKQTLRNQSLIEYIDRLEGYEKLYGIADEPFCIVVKKNIGIEITKFIK